MEDHATVMEWREGGDEPSAAAMRATATREKVAFESASVSKGMLFETARSGNLITGTPAAGSISPKGKSHVQQSARNKTGVSTTTLCTE